MHFKKIEKFGNLEMGYVSDFSGGYISRNQNLLNELTLNPLTQFILEKSVYGTPILRLGRGGNRILVLSGIHGNELPPQIANMRIINELAYKELHNTIYFIPFASPKSSMFNERTFNDLDLNRAAHIKNSLSNLIIQAVDKFKISFVGDFHSTAVNANPGFESVFSSKSPCPESFLIANYIAGEVGCDIISYDYAGSSYKGAVEDVCNLKGIPAVTCEVLSPFANVATGSAERSYLQMRAFLSYFGI